MKRLMSSLHFTRWLRVVAIAGVVVASGASAVKDTKRDGYATTSTVTRTASSWCMRC